MKIRDRLPLGLVCAAALLGIGLLGVRAARPRPAAVRPPPPPALVPASGAASPRAGSPQPDRPRAAAAPQAARREPLRVTGARGRASAGAPSAIEVSFDRPIEPAPPSPGRAAGEAAPPRLEDFFSVAPAAAFRARAGGMTVVLEGAFEPGRRYRVVVRRGLAGAGGAALPADAAREVRIPDLAPALVFPGALILPPRGRPAIPLDAINIDALGACAVRIPPEDLVRFWVSGEPAVPGGAGPRAHPLAPAPNRVRSLGLRLDDIAGPDPRGAWRIQAFAAAGGKPLFAEEIVIVSDIAITLLEHPGGIAVWTTSMTGGAPIAGADVALLDRSAAPIAEARTGPHGLAAFPRPAGPDAAFVLARRGPDVSLLEVAGRPAAAAAEGGGGGVPREAFVFTDRAACAPGDTVRIHAWTRGLDGSLPAGLPIEIAAVRPDGEPLPGVGADLSASGTAGASIAISATAPCGLWRAEARAGGRGASSRLLGAAAFLVEEPPRLRHGVEIALGIRAERARALRPGEDLEVIATGTTAGGLPASGTRAIARWRIAPRAAPLAGWPGYTFGEAGAWDGSWGPEDVEASIDGRGEARLWIAVPQIEAALPLELRLSASTRRAAEGLARDLLAVSIDPAPAYLGLRLEDGASGGGPRSARFECVAVRPDGRLADVDAADLQIMRVRWRAAPRRTSGRSIRHEHRDEVEEIGRRRVALPGGRGGFEVALEEDGFHRIRIKDPASLAAAELTVHAGTDGGGFAVTSLEGPHRLRLAFRDAAVRPGERALLCIVSPFEGTLLLVAETDRIAAASVMPVSAGSQDVEVRIPERPGGPVWFAALAASGPAPGASMPRRAFARIRAPLEPGALRLVVTVSAPVEARPGARVPVRAAVAAEDGSPVAGANVALGLLDPRSRRGGATPPDPHAFFHEEPAGGFRIEDAVFLDVPACGPLDAVSPAGPGPRAAHLGPFVTGEDGTIVLEIEAPPFEGEAVLFAMACAGALAGAGERPIQLRAALPIEATWPPVLAAGDSFELPVVIGDGWQAPGPVELRWLLDGLIEVPLAGEAGARFASRRAAGPGAASAETVFGLRARWRSGTASATLAARRGGEEASAAARIPIRPRAIPERRWEIGAIDASRPLERAPPPGALPGSRSYRLIVSRDPLADLAPALHALLDREPLVLEEWTCRGLPLLHLGALAGSLLGGDAAAPRREVLAAIDAVLGLRGPGGLLAGAPGGPARASPAVLAAALFLAEARSMGYPVPDGPLGEVLDAITSSVLGAPWRSRADDALDRARALHALALAGRVDRGALDSLRIRLALSELEASGPDLVAASAHLAAALAASGSPGEALALLDEHVLDAAAGPGTAPREAALALTALSRAGAPAEHERIAGLIDTLLDCRVGGSWRTLEETALALSAVGMHAAAARLAPRWALAPPGSGLRAEVRAGPGPAAEVDLDGFAAFGGEWPDGSVRAVVAGAGAVRYAFLQEWAPADPEGAPRAEGIRVAGRLLDRRLEPLDPAAVRRGDLVVVEIALAVEGAAARGVGNGPARAVVIDRLAGGLEVEDLAPGELASQESLPLERAVLRRGEAVFVLSLQHAAAGVHRYLARAVLRGDFALGPIEATLLEEPGVRGASAPGILRIR